MRSAFACVQAVILLSVATIWPSSGQEAQAQTVRQDFSVTDGGVGTAVVSGNTLYISGSFTQVGPATGGGVSIDAASGISAPGFPKVAGAVYTAAPDGAGGWYIGGSFGAVGGFARSNLAHILANNTVAAWAPNSSGSNISNEGVIWALAVSGTTVYAGGDFSSIGGQSRNNIAALDGTTGSATSWNANANGIVRALAVNGATVYAGGYFTSIGGQSRKGIAALDGGSGLATAWNPYTVVPDTCCSGGVVALAVDGSTVYVGGYFTSIGGQPRYRIAALDAGTGLATAWNPEARASCFCVPSVQALAVSGTTVYVAGLFNSIGGQPRNSIAALDAATGLATPWDPGAAWGLNAGNTVNSIAVSGSTVYVGGNFTSIGGQPRNNIAALDATTGLPTAWNPSTNGLVYTVVPGGSAVFAGGPFTSVGGQRRNGLAALDLTTGLVTAWDPNPNGPVGPVALSGAKVYVGGSFTSIGGQPRKNIAALDPLTGLATDWNPSANYSVNTLVVDGSVVYAGGQFDSIGAQRRDFVAALDAATGLATSWNPGADNGLYTLAVSGNIVYAGGFFTRIGGQTRNRIAALDATSGLATAWDANANAEVFGLVVDGSTVYAGGAFTNIGGQTRNRIAALDGASGLATAWDPNANLDVGALAVSGATVYVGGSFTSIGGQSRSRIAALNATTGLATAWDPNANNVVNTLLVSGEKVYVGGFFTGIGGLRQSGIAALGDVTTPTLLSLVSARAASDRTWLTWFAAPDLALIATVYRRSAGRDWQAVSRISPDGTGQLFYEDARVTAGTRYGYRLGVQRDQREEFWGETWVDVPVGPEFALAGVRPNPVGRELALAFSLPDAARATLELIDIGGRRVIAREVGHLGAGSHVVNLATGRTLAPGVYVVRLSRHHRSLTARAVVVR